MLRCSILILLMLPGSSYTSAQRSNDSKTAYYTHLSVSSVLEWSTADLDNRKFEQTAYSVMKKWLELERWNRRHRKMGLQTGIHWTTNCVPTSGGNTFM